VHEQGGIEDNAENFEILTPPETPMQQVKRFFGRIEKYPVCLSPEVKFTLRTVKLLLCGGLRVFNLVRWYREPLPAVKIVGKHSVYEATCGDRTSSVRVEKIPQRRA
jgi:hypothetical protein